MKISNKMALVFLALIMVPFIAFAAGKQESVPSTGPVTIDVWYALSGTTGENFMRAVSNFNASQSDIVAVASYSGGYNDTATKITAALKSNSTPDVIIGGQVAYTGAYGNFYAGNQALADPAFDFADVFEGLWDYSNYDGQYCNIPYNMSTNTMFYNKALVEAAGLDMENNAPTSWEEFMAVCAILKDYYKGKASFVPFVVQDEDWLTNTQILQCNNPVIAANEDFSVKSAAWGSEECAKVAQWWQDMVKNGYMVMAMNKSGNNVFLAGNAAFFAGSSTKISEWTPTLGEDLRAIEMPYFDVQKVALGGSSVAIYPKSSERTDAAWKFVKFICEADENALFAIDSGYLPIRKSSFTSPAVTQAIETMPAYAVAFKQLSYAYAYLNIDDYAAKANALAKFRTLVTEDLSYNPLKAMQESAEAYNKELY
ncbi:MAG TPA: extracellular solute-binding protein [Sphaerochaeta sp.]|nr:extracellular solute-binding protein [Sphaerochaeta sp.]